MPRIRVIGVIAAALLLLGLAACSAPETDGDTDASAESSSESDSNALTAIDLETGEAVDSLLVRGQDTMIWFWASWCPVCAGESGAIVGAMAEPDWPDSVTMLGVAGLSDVEQAKVFVDEHGLDGFSHVYDTDGSIWQVFGVTGQPAFAFVNDDGTYTVQQGGIGKWDVLKKAQELAEN